MTLRQAQGRRTVGVIGAGAWGTALAQFARQLGTTVLAACEQVHGCPPNGDGGVEYGGHVGYLPRNQ